jgi:3'-phosphoadenosine 5'-phosphosulfate sulfotransferase (PAPS reductase)/FAD synthetase
MGIEKSLEDLSANVKALTVQLRASFSYREPKHVIGISGGKDSTAMAMRLMETEPRDYEFICNATGNELPELFTHLAKLEKMFGKEFKRVTYHTDLIGMIEEIGMLPNFRARFCTRMLKIEPTIEYFESLPPGSTLYVGLRADEEERKGLYGEDINIRFPMREWGWGIDDVWKYLDENGIVIPKRTDCALCYGQRIDEWFSLWRDNRPMFDEGIRIEQKHGHTFRSDGRDTWPAALIDLGKEFESGRPLRKRKARAETCRVCSI